MERQLAVREEYLYLPIRTGQEEVKVEIFQNEEGEFEKLYEFMVPVCQKRQEEYEADFYAELPVNLSDAGFVVNADLLPASIDDKHMFGMMFDVKGNSRFQAILFNKKQYYVISCDKGEMTVDKKGLYKVQKNPKIIQFGGFQHIGDITPLVDNSKLMSVTMVYDHGTATFFLNGLEITSVKNVQIEYPAFGFFTDGKSKLKGYGFTYSLLMSDDDEEEQ